VNLIKEIYEIMVKLYDSFASHTKGALTTATR